MTSRRWHRLAAPDRGGFAMVTTLLVVLVISVLALGVAWLAGSEKKTTFAEGVHIRSVLAADAGSEAGINFIRVADTPPLITDFATWTVQDQAETILLDSQSYEYDCRYVNRQGKPGWGMDYFDYEYAVGSAGRAATQGRTDVQVLVTRLFKAGY